MLDRSSRPHCSPTACSAEQLGQFERLPLWRMIQVEASPASKYFELVKTTCHFEVGYVT